MWRPAFSPIAPIIVAEFDAIDRPVTGAFQTFVGGRTGQLGAPGSVGDPAGGGGGGGGGVTGVGFGWLLASRGFVPARTSTLSAYPSPSVSALRGFVPSRCSV